MLADYRMLGLAPGATDEQIRGRYLEMVKKHSPEHDPERFQDINHAYERIRDQRARIHNDLFGYRDVADVDESLGYLVRAFKPARRRAGLQELLNAVKK